MLNVIHQCGDILEGICRRFGAAFAQDNVVHDHRGTSVTCADIYHRTYCIPVNKNYLQVSNIRHTESQHLKDSRTVLRLSLLNPLKPDVKSRMKM